MLLFPFGNRLLEMQPESCLPSRGQWDYRKLHNYLQATTLYPVQEVHPKVKCLSGESQEERARKSTLLKCCSHFLEEQAVSQLLKSGAVSCEGSIPGSDPTEKPVWVWAGTSTWSCGWWRLARSCAVP